MNGQQPEGVEMSSESVGKKKVAAVPYVVIAVVTAAAMAIAAVVGAPGMTYAIVAIVAGLCYSLVAVLKGRRSLVVLGICPGAW
jgi:hypothetical protein